MPIQEITPEFVGEVGVHPRLVRIVCDDTFDDVIASNYLLSRVSQGFVFYPTDMVAVSFQDFPGEISVRWFTVFIAYNPYIITLFPLAGTQIVPTVDGNLAQYNDTEGTLSDSGIPHNQVLTSSIVEPDTSSNLFCFDITVGQAALAAGGSVTLVDSSLTKQYKVRNLQINRGGTNFSGGGGDRLGQVTDGTTVYSVIPAASLQTLANAQWGATALPNPASAAINTSTVAGADLVFKYSGGTTDYTAGSVVVSGLIQRVA
jgi:hypothetical protein